MSDAQNEHSPVGIPYATYDTALDIVYIYFRPIPRGVQRRAVAALDQTIWLDLDSNGEILGVEIPDATKRVPTLVRSAPMVPAPIAALRIEPTDSNVEMAPTGRLNGLSSDTITRILGITPRRVDNLLVWGFLGNKQVCVIRTTIHQLVVTQGHADVFVTLFGDRYQPNLEGMEQEGKGNER